MKPVEQMTCEELEAELYACIETLCDVDAAGYVDAMLVMAELKSRRLAQSAG